jgi:branched-chain amino acid transport system ATP-binding protein
MLAIARGLMQNPQLLLLDEITEGLAPIIVNQLVEIIQELIRRKVSILVAEQNVKFALSVSDDCYILEKGEVVHHEPSKLLGKEIIQKYLGT